MVASQKSKYKVIDIDAVVVAALLSFSFTKKLYDT